MHWMDRRFSRLLRNDVAFRVRPAYRLTQSALTWRDTSLQWFGDSSGRKSQSLILLRILPREGEGDCPSKMKLLAMLFDISHHDRSTKMG